MLPGVMHNSAELTAALSEIENELVLHEQVLAAPSLLLESTAEAVKAARAAVAAASADDPSIPAAELVKRRRDAADRLEVAEIEHQRAESAAENASQDLQARLATIARGLEPVVMDVADARKRIVFDALRVLLGKGADRLPSRIEASASWVSGLTNLQLPLRAATGDPRSLIALIRSAVAALADAGPAVLR